MKHFKNFNFYKLLVDSIFLYKFSKLQSRKKWPYSYLYINIENSQDELT